MTRLWVIFDVYMPLMYGEEDGVLSDLKIGTVTGHASLVAYCRCEPED